MKVGRTLAHTTDLPVSISRDTLSRTIASSFRERFYDPRFFHLVRCRSRGRRNYARLFRSFGSNSSLDTRSIGQ